MRGSIVPVERIHRTILFVRGRRVIIDADLAELYQVPTKALNQAVKRNPARFPADFMFRLTPGEKAEVVTNCDHLARLKFSKALPHAFTEHGVLMAANVLNSTRAEQMSLAVVREFVRLREMLAGSAGLARRLDELERRYDSQFKVVFDAVRALMAEPRGRRKPPVGYLTEEGKKPGK